jgi:transcriptional regulator with XRE-family HTH domain
MARRTRRPRQQPRYRPTFIRQWRQHRGLTLEALADLIGMTHASLSRLERGLQPYNQAVLEALARALKCTPTDLLDRNPSDPEVPASIFDRLPPTRQRDAIRLLKALVDE